MQFKKIDRNNAKKMQKLQVISDGKGIKTENDFNKLKLKMISITLMHRQLL